MACRVSQESGFSHTREGLVATWSILNLRLICFGYGIFFSYLLIQDFWGSGMRPFVLLEALLGLIYLAVGAEFRFFIKNIPTVLLGFLVINGIVWAWMIPRYGIEGNFPLLLVASIGLLGTVYLVIAAHRCRTTATVDSH